MKTTALCCRLLVALLAFLACSIGISRVHAADQKTTFLSFTEHSTTHPGLPPFNTNLVLELQKLSSEIPRNWVENIVMNGSFSSISMGYGHARTGEDIFRFPRFVEHVGRRNSSWLEGGILCRYPLNDGAWSYDGGWAMVIAWCRSF